MPQQIKRLIIAFSIVLFLFLVLQQVLKPDSFGKLGHYRFKAIKENSMKEMYYAGSANCIKCHETIRTDKSEGYHEQLKCEVCHGPGLKHNLYADRFKTGHLPDSLMLFKPTERKNCAICHQENAARTKILFDSIDNSKIVMINAMKHNLLDRDTKKELKCIECHNPHQP